MLEQWLYLNTHPVSWGDGQSEIRQLVALKDRYPMSVVYGFSHERDVWVNGLMYAAEGIIDHCLGFPSELQPNVSALSKFMMNRLPVRAYDRIVLGWCLDVDVNVLLSSLRYTNLYSIEASYNYYQSTFQLPVQKIDCLVNSEFYRAHSIKESVDRLWGQVHRPAIAIHPFSTRVHSAISYLGFTRIVQALTPTYDVIILGTQHPYYQLSLRLCDAAQSCLDWVGLSPLKQLEVMRRCQATLISTTGAVIWSFHHIPIVCINAGEWSTEYFARYTPSLHLVNCRCDRFPCDGSTGHERYEKCKSIPQCLDAEIDIDSIMEAIQKVGCSGHNGVLEPAPGGCE